MDLAKMERVVTYNHDFSAQGAGTERSINKALGEGWVIVTSKIVQVGDERDGLRSQHCIVLGKPRAPKPQTDLKNVEEVFIQQCAVSDMTSNMINDRLKKGWVIQRLQHAVERRVRDGEVHEHNYVLLIMYKPKPVKRSRKSASVPDAREAKREAFTGSSSP